MYNDFAISDAERLYYTNVHKERKEQYEVISHKNHLLYREVLTAFGDHPCCLSLLYHMRKFLSIKNFNGAASGVVFSCRSALIQTAGREIPIYQLSGQLHRGGRPPADKLQHRESRLRLSVLFLPYPGSPPAGLPRFYASAFPSFARSGRPLPAPSRYIIYYKHI